VIVHWEFIYTNEETGVADTMQANLDLPKDWWVSVIALVLFAFILQFLAGRVMWIRALRVSGAGRRVWSFSNIFYTVVLPQMPDGTYMAPPCKRNFIYVHHDETVTEV